MTAASLDPGLAAYLLTNREFMAPAVAEAIGSLPLPARCRALDAGTGAGGALPPLARAVGDGGTVLGVDLNPAVVALAREYAERSGVSARVTLRAVDLADVLAAASAGNEGFDVIWASDVVWPGNFDHPAETVGSMARALRPGGVVALFYSHYYRATFLLGHSRLERLLRGASELRWGLPQGGPHRHERYLAWLIEAGPYDVGLTVFPRVGFPVDGDPTVRSYLESTVWPEMLQSADERGPQVGLTDDDRTDVRELLTPGSDRYILDEPGFHVVHPTILASGRRLPA